MTSPAIAEMPTRPRAGDRDHVTRDRFPRRPDTRLTDSDLNDDDLTDTDPSDLGRVRRPSPSGPSRSAQAGAEQGSSDLVRLTTLIDRVHGPVRAPSPDSRVVPCQGGDADLWFAQDPQDVEAAKALCRTCPLQQACLDGALRRGEPCGVWGGELFVSGKVVARKRPRGRPRKDAAVA